MTPIHILIVEDDFLNRRLIRKVLQEQQYLVSEAKNLTEAMDNLEKRVHDLAILDINLGETEQNGIHLGQLINENYGIPFLYLTACGTPVIVKKAIHTAPKAYITKPFKNVDLLASVEIALQQVSDKASPISYLVVRDADYHAKIPVHDIDFIESEGNYLLIHQDGKRYRVRSTIRKIMDEIPTRDFIQTHRGFLVNRHKVQKFTNKALIVNSISIPVSRSFLSRIREDLFSIESSKGENEP